MGGKTLTRADLAEAVVQKVGLPRNESQDLVELILQEISTSLAAGETVKLSSFGSFVVRNAKEWVATQRPARSAHFGASVMVFKPSPSSRGDELPT